MNRPAPRAPWMAVASMVIALLYDVSPIDIVPDLIPLVGWLDDATLSAVLTALALVSWRKWAKARRMARA